MGEESPFRRTASVSPSRSAFFSSPRASAVPVRPRPAPVSSHRTVLLKNVSPVLSAAWPQPPPPPSTTRFTMPTEGSRTGPPVPGGDQPAEKLKLTKQSQFRPSQLAHTGDTAPDTCPLKAATCQFCRTVPPPHKSHRISAWIITSGGTAALSGIRVHRRSSAVDSVGNRALPHGRRRVAHLHPTCATQSVLGPQNQSLGHDVS